MLAALGIFVIVTLRRASEFIGFCYGDTDCHRVLNP